MEVDTRLKYVLTRVLGGGSSVYHLYFMRADILFNNQARIEGITLRLSKKGVISFNNKLTHQIPNIPIVPTGDDTVYVLQGQNGYSQWVEKSTSSSGDASFPMIMAYEMEGQILQEQIIPLEQILAEYSEVGLFTIKVALVNAETGAIGIYSVYKIDSNTMIVYFSNTAGQPLVLTPDGVLAYEGG